MESPLSSMFGINHISLLSNAQSRSICGENPRGEVAGACKEVPDEKNPASNLGKGWKVRPCIPVKKGETICLADIQGPGQITHIWMTVIDKVYRNLILRIYWDGEDTPSVETPIGDFFCNGHALRYNVNSMMILSNPSGGFNSYWPMPFRKSCKITIESTHHEDTELFFYQIDYTLCEIPREAAYFHALYRRATTDRQNPDYLIVDNIQGQGHYVGTFLAWSQLSNGWWGEGEVKFYMDGDQEYPTICGTGTEDYFGGAWCFGETYSTPFLGYPLWRKEPGEVPKHACYRWHIMDPIRFQKNLKVTIQALGWWPNSKFQPLADDIASVAYWYQTEPHTRFPDFPDTEQRFTR